MLHVFSFSIHNNILRQNSFLTYQSVLTELSSIYSGIIVPAEEKEEEKDKESKEPPAEVLPTNFL
jgi:hypothetical protein